uniref:Uncharacterized protein n=1 Tax=Macrostomum lignano TaxID=282301 RepID=A0A1I8JBP3_9PLAT
GQIKFQKAFLTGCSALFSIEASTAAAAAAATAAALPDEFRVNDSSEQRQLPKVDGIRRSTGGASCINSRVAMTTLTTLTLCSLVTLCASMTACRLLGIREELTLIVPGQSLTGLGEF